MTKEELILKLGEVAHTKDANEARNDYLLILRSVVDWAVQKTNMEFEVYDDISYGESIAGQEVYELIKKELG